MILDEQTIPYLFAAVFALFLVLGVILVILSIGAERKRNEELLALATSLNLQYSINDPFDIDSRQDWRKVFPIGHSREVNHMLYGRVDGCDLKAFDYKYETGSDKDETTYHLSAVIFDTDMVFRTLVIRRETFGDRFAGAIGFNDIDFESEEFSRKFFVKSDDKKFAYDVVHQKMMQFLLENPGWDLHLISRSLIFYNSRVFSPEQFATAISFGRQFLSLFPDYLKQQLRTTQETT
jgi:hypothetical protein